MGARRQLEALVKAWDDVGRWPEENSERAAVERQFKQARKFLAKERKCKPAGNR